VFYKVSYLYGPFSLSLSLILASFISVEELSEATMQQQRRNENTGPSNIPEQHSNRPGSGNQLDQGFNIDDILHLDVIPGQTQDILITLLLSFCIHI
jgi:hypothetical protein